MERGQVIILSVVVAALALFGLKIWSDRSAESSFEAASGAAAERLARAGGLRADGSGSDSGSSSGGEGGEFGRTGGGSMRAGGALGGRIGSGADGRGSAETARGGLRGSGGGVVGGGSGSRVAGGGGSAGVAGGADGPGIGPKVQQRDSLVEFLGSQPPTQNELASPENAVGEDVALKLDKVDDIDEQGGEGRNVEDAEDGDGIKITEESNIQFPNNVNPEAATFSFKIQPEWAGSDQTDNALLQLRGQHEWSNRLELVKNGEFLRFILTDNTGREADISFRITDWVAGEEHEIRSGYADGETWLEVDGRVVGRNRYEGQLDFQQGVPLQVGGDWPNSNYQPANSIFKDFQILNSSTNGG